MLFAILFGLSMDYNVFLLSRIHEAYNEGDGPRESVIHGMGRIGKVVVFAGLIMAAVFLSFVTQRRPHRQDVRPRPRPRDPDRRADRPHGHRTRGGDAARRPRLVAARPGWTACSRTSRSKGARRPPKPSRNARRYSPSRPPRTSLHPAPASRTTFARCCFPCNSTVSSSSGAVDRTLLLSRVCGSGLDPRDDLRSRVDATAAGEAGARTRNEPPGSARAWW